MRLLEKMKAELNHLWRQAMLAKSSDARSEILGDYHSAYERYKKQIEFFEAMKDHAPMKGMARENQIQN